MIVEAGINPAVDEHIEELISACAAGKRAAAGAADVACPLHGASGSTKIRRGEVKVVAEL